MVTIKRWFYRRLLPGGIWGLRNTRRRPSPFLHWDPDCRMKLSRGQRWLIIFGRASKSGGRSSRSRGLGIFRCSLWTPYHFPLLYVWCLAPRFRGSFQLTTSRWARLPSERHAWILVPYPTYFDLAEAPQLLQDSYFVLVSYLISSLMNRLTINQYLYSLDILSYLLCK